MADHDKELQFARALEEVRELAKEQGSRISEEQVKEMFSGQDLSDGQFGLIYDYLKKSKIGVNEAVDPEDYMTEEEKDHLEDYLGGLKGLKRYTGGEKEAAFLLAMAGDRTGQEQLTEIYLPEVAEIAKLYTGQGVFVEDLIGEGNVALTVGVTLLGCVETWSEAEGILVKMIMDAMEELIVQTDRMQKTDKKMEDKVNMVAEAARELAEAMGRKVTVQELAAESRISETAIREALGISGNAIGDIEY